MVRTTTAAVTDLLLDTYPGAAAAYSVRKLDKDYTGYCMKVRRASDDAEADIGFDGNGGVDQSAIATHCSGSNGFVSVLYDQSGNARNLTQSTSGIQPQIYNGSAVISENAKPAIYFDGTESGGKALVSAGFGTGETRYLSYVNRITQDVATTGYHNVLIFMEDVSAITAGDFLQSYTTNASNSINVNFPTSALDMSNTTATNVQHLLTIQKTSTDAEFWIDGTSQDTATGTQALEDELALGRFLGGSGAYAVMRFQELVVWNTDQDGLGNRTGIETDIDTYFSIT